jgi:hypothetical protein
MTNLGPCSLGGIRRKANDFTLLKKLLRNPLNCKPDDLIYDEICKSGRIF